MDFAYEHVQLAGKIIHGYRAIEEMSGEPLLSTASRVQIIVSPSVARSVLAERVSAAVARSGTQVAVSEGVLPHVPLGSVITLSREIAAFGPSIVVAVGGGSALDTAKAAVFASATATPLDQLHRGLVGAPSCLGHRDLPLIITIPTTFSGAERTGAFSITHNARKLNYVEEHVRPILVIQDVEAIESTPRTLLVGSAMNSMAHSVEALEQRSCSPFARIHHLAAIRLYMQYLPRVLAVSEDRTANGQLFIACALAEGITGDRSGGGPGIVHAAAHAITGLEPIPHGQVFSALLMSGLQFNSAYISCLSEITSALTGGRSERFEDGVECVESLLRKARLPTRLRELGVVQSMIPRIAKSAMAHFATARNVRSIRSISDMEEFLNAAY